MTIVAKNGVTYTVRMSANENLEIEHYNENTGLNRLFVFEDFTFGNVLGKRKEVVFQSYDIAPTGERIKGKRVCFKDNEDEFNAFMASEAMLSVMNSVVLDFLKKVEFTEPTEE